MLHSLRCDGKIQRMEVRKKRVVLFDVGEGKGEWGAERNGSTSLGKRAPNSCCVLGRIERLGATMGWYIMVHI